MADLPALSRRERQIMDVLYQLGEATAAEVQERLPEPPSYSAVRAMLRILEEKGHVRHKEDGPRYVFAPVVARDSAQRTAASHLLRKSEAHPWHWKSIRMAPGGTAGATSPS